MRRVSTIVVMLAIITVSIMAIPAHKKPIQVTQPDGTTVTIQLHGDEWLHFNTTADGYSVVKNQQGFYVYAEKKNGELKATQMVAHNALERKANELAFLQNVKKYQVPDMTPANATMKGRVEAIGAQRRAQGNRATNYENFKGLIVLIQYNDKEFSREDYPTIINDMVNQQNYTGFDNNQRTGSVRDYFTDNSEGKFQPQFDVVGPYTVNYSQYDANVNGGKCRKILVDALNQADADVNFKNYDGDSDGAVDLVFFIMAGNGANYGGNDENLWWPHRSVIFDEDKHTYIYKDGVMLWDYASATELCGHTAYPQSVFIDGIGTICHEFSHVLGLPDFYDSDYEENGQSVTPGDWSLMDSGCYLDNAFTPAGYSLYERYMVGFTDNLEAISQPGDYTLEPLANNQKGYRLNTPEPNEFFVMENRQKNAFKWDAYLPGNGMLVHRVDLSNQSVWQSNTVNANPKHNYYELLRADGVKGGASASDPFPGSKKVHELTNVSSPANLKTWAGKENQFGLTNILQDTDGNITFTIDIYELLGLSFGEIPPIGVGVTYQLAAISEPSYAQYSLTWESKDKSIATVDENGVVKGISAGTCEITATSDNDIQASCFVTIVDLPHYTIDEFKQQPTDQIGILELTNTEVLYTYQKDNIQIAFLRDATGAIMLYDANLPIQTDDILNGTVIVKAGISNKVPQAIGLAGSTNDEHLSIVAGSGVQPREVSFEDLTEADYSDLVVVKATKLKRSNGIWAYDNNSRARVWANEFGIPTGISSSEKFTDKFYDVTAIYGTDIKSNISINQLNVTKAVKEVEAPTGIKQITNSQKQTTNSPIYNMAGQRVDASYKGLVIKNGKKTINK